MTRYYDADHEPTTAADLARDVLGDDEQAAYAASKRNRPRHRTDRRPVRERWDELGYSTATGNWSPEKEAQ